MVVGTCAGILQGVRDVENSSPSERVAAARGDDRESVCYGFRVDDEREHQPVPDGTSRREPVRTRKSSIQVLTTLTSC